MRQILILGLIVQSALVAGCSRTRYRTAADQDSYSLLQQKAAGTPWTPPSDFSLHPDPTSRLHDPTPVDDPWLPHPAPQLYSYQLPELPKHERRPTGLQNGTTGGMPAPTVEIPTPPEVHVDSQAGIQRLPPLSEPASAPDVRLANHLGPVAPNRNNSSIGVSQASFSHALASQQPAGPAPPPNQATATTTQDSVQYSSDIRVVPIPHEAWNAIPLTSRVRMFEFDSLLEEYRLSFEGAHPPQDQIAPGQRLTLEDIIHLTLLNSREYQTQKEILYRTALRLSLERFAYQLKFSPFANGVDVNWNHTRSGGTTVNGLSIPTRLQLEKTLASGGDFIARFANDVVLTFNGPTGFAADVGSDLFFQLDQTIFQRDVRFESLTQAERDVVYAARSFTRFRKLQFAQLASQYYNLIRNYRQIEIESQNYFTLVRAFQQSQSEFRTIGLPRFQLDQVEQNVLSGRSRLVATTNNLESALDNLKIRIGLPTETYVNIDLQELEQLTTRDELSVGGELIRRVRQRLLEDRAAPAISRVALLSSSIIVIERMLESREILQRNGVATPELDDLPELLRRLQIDSARENAEPIRLELEKELMVQPPSLPIVFQRTLDLIDALIEVTQRQVHLGDLTVSESPELQQHRMRIAKYRSDANDYLEAFRNLIKAEQSGGLPPLVQQAQALRMDIEAAIVELDRLLGIPAGRPTAQEEMQLTVATADQILARSQAMLNNLQSGLTPVEIALDDAMLTALNLRLDLMNQRGDVADNWRQIKYAGDDLRSILNVSASQRISTRRDVNRVFDFTLDESETRVSASFDAPFNRFAQRNVYRQSLINYQAALRDLMQLEDSIKLGVRNDLRSLALDKEQYEIEVASAALAYERVLSVRLELRLGIGRAATRDFLEAQNAYASSLSNVAIRHIGYILDRTQLFLDLELLTVGEDGFWEELYDEEFQPEPYYQIPTYALPVYGELVPGLWYSRSIRRMEHIPPGVSAIQKPDEPAKTDEEVIPVPEGLEPNALPAPQDR